MANYANVLAEIAAAITANNNQEITGPVLSAVLADMVSSLGQAGYQFKGVATESTAAGSPDMNIFYIAGPGTYANFGGAVIDEGFVGVFSYNGTWTVSRILTASDILVSVPFTIAESCNATGAFHSNSAARRTDYIEVVSGTKIVAYDGGTNTAYRACNFYDENKRWISCISFPSSGLKTIVLSADNIPSGAKYFVSCTLTSMLSDSSVTYNRLNKLEDEIGAINAEMDDVEEINRDYKSLPSAIVSRNVSVDSGARFDTTFDMRQYVGRAVTVRIVKTGGTSAEFAIYNDENDYWVGSVFNYGTDISFVLNEKLANMRIMGMALEGSSGTFSVSITIAAKNGLSRLGDTTIFSAVPYTPNSGYYINGNSASLPANPTALSGAASVSGEISPGDTLVVNGAGTSKIITLFAFYNSARQRILLAGAGNTNGLGALEVIAPANAAYFVYNTYPYDSTRDSVEVHRNFTVNELRQRLDSVEEEVTENRQDIDKLLWPGKKIVCFGDSITEFADSGEKQYTDYLAALSGAQIVNAGIGGTRLACRTTPVASPSNATQGYAALDCANIIDAVATQNWSIVDAGALYLKNNEGDDNTPIIARVKAVDWSTVAAVTFFIGTNDWGGSQAFGTSGENSKTTVLGAVNFIVSTLLTAYPHLKIYWFTPCVRWLASSLAQRTVENWGGVATRGGRTLEQFCDSVEGEVEKNSIPVCDMYHTLGWTMYNFSQYFNDNDGTHPIKGFPEIARRFFSFIKSVQTF